MTLTGRDSSRRRHILARRSLERVWIPATQVDASRKYQAAICRHSTTGILSEKILGGFFSQYVVRPRRNLSDQRTHFGMDRLDIGVDTELMQNLGAYRTDRADGDFFKTLPQGVGLVTRSGDLHEMIDLCAVGK